MKIKILKKNTLHTLIGKVINAIYFINEELSNELCNEDEDYYFMASVDNAFISDEYIKFTFSVHFYNNGDFIELHSNMYEYDYRIDKFIMDLFPGIKQLKRELNKLEKQFKSEYPGEPKDGSTKEAWDKLDKMLDERDEKYRLKLINLANEFKFHLQD